MHRIAICGLSGSIIFFHLSHQRYDFLKKKKKLLNIKCVFRFSLHSLLEAFLILTRIRRDIIINIHIYACKVPVNLVRF